MYDYIQVQPSIERTNEFLINNYKETFQSKKKNTMESVIDIPTENKSLRINGIATI